MKSYGLTLCLKPDMALIERYREHHRQVWPEVLAGLRGVGIVEMRIYLLIPATLGEGQPPPRMFMYVEAEDHFDPARDFARANASPRAQEWDRLMRTLQQRAPEAPPDQWWALMEEVFDLNWPQHRGPA